MKRTLAVLAASLAMLASPARAQPLEAPPPTSVTNAALLYYRYWLVMPDELREALRKEYTGKPAWRPGEELANLLEQNQDIVRGLLKASYVEHCDWGIEIEESINTLLPHLSELRTSTRLLSADARRLMDAGEIDAASERIAALYRMSAHAAREPVLISSLVSLAILSRAGDEVQELIATGSLTATARDMILNAIDTLDQDDPGHLRQAIEGERTIFLGGIRRQFSGPDAGKHLADAMEQQDWGVPPPVVAAVRAANAAMLAQDLSRAEQFYDEVLQVWDQPDALQQITRLEQAVENGRYGRIGPIILPAISRAYQSGVESARKLQRIRGLLAEAKVESPSP